MATSWNDPSLIGVTIRSSHIDQLRNALKLELIRRCNNNIAFTDLSLTPDVSIDKATHINELRDMIYNINGVSGYTDGYKANIAVTTIRAVHIQELRQQVNNLENKPLVSSSSDCTGGCTGLCISCTSSCSGTCVNACSQGCNSTCTGTCTGGCSGTCTGSCTGCSGCTACSGCGPW